MNTSLQERPVTLHRPVAKPAAPSDERWPLAEVEALFELPFLELMHRAQTVHRENFPAGDVQLSTLLSIKTGGCPEDCGYCPQSVHYDTGTPATKMLGVDVVVAAAKAAQKTVTSITWPSW